jgi:acetyl-CoA carboxylase biotin carboxyl carrier protein
MASVNVNAELAANVWKVLVEPGQAVAEGDVLMILESMKMEIPVESPCDGTIASLAVAAEAQVQDGDLLAVIDRA